MKILFLAHNYKEYKAALLNAMKQNGLQELTLTNDKTINPDEVSFIIYSSSSLPKDQQFIDFSCFKNNQAILSLWAGVEQLISNPTIGAIPLIRMVDDNLTRAMMEWCIAHTMRIHLGVDRHILGQDGLWRNNICSPLAYEKSIGILGLGELGKAVAQNLQHLGFQINGWSRRKKNIHGVNCFYENAGLVKVLKNSSILILLLPLTKNTFEIINTKTLKMLPKNATLINPGRGELINEKDLLHSINSGHLLHATLDVFAEEPLPANHPYWIHPKILVTPHIAATTQVLSSASTIMKNIKRILMNKKPIGLVDKNENY